MNHSRRGGILGSLLVALLLLIFVIPTAIFYVVRQVRVREYRTASGTSVRLETPFGDFGVRSHRNLDPEAIGIPVYPGAVRDGDHAGGAVFEMDSNNEEHRAFAVSGAGFTTSDSAERVRAFYHDQFPNWMVTERDGHDWRIEGSKDGYKRLIAIQEHDGRTHIGLSAFGAPAVN